MFLSINIAPAWCDYFNPNFPNSKPKVILSRNVHIVWRVDDQGRGIGKTQPEWSICQIKQRVFARSEIIFHRILLKQGDCLALSSFGFQSQIFYIRLAITVTRRALFDCGFELVNHMQMKYSGYGGVIGRAVMHLKPSALVRGSGGNSQVSLRQFN